VTSKAVREARVVIIARHRDAIGSHTALSRQYSGGKYPALTWRRGLSHVHHQTGGREIQEQRKHGRRSLARRELGRRTEIHW
jgi:hypothetical protein